MDKEKNCIENFLQSVCRFVSTEERAKDIQDELRDHIDSYVHEYTTNGMTIEDATYNALKQMGDPDSLSKDFKDKISNKRRLFMLGFISSFLLILLSIDIYSYMNNIFTILDLCFNLLFIGCCIPLFITSLRTYIKSRKLEKEDPIFYIQSYKESNWHENTLKPFKWLYIFSIFTIITSYLSDFKDIPSNELLFETLESTRLLVMELLLVITLMSLTPKRQKSIVYTDGILTFESFLPWDSIAGYRWSKQNSKGKVIHYIELKFKKKSSSKKNYLLRSQLIKVSSYQINLIDEIFKSKNIEQRHAF